MKNLSMPILPLAYFSLGSSGRIPAHYAGLRLQNGYTRITPSLRLGLGPLPRLETRPSVLSFAVLAGHPDEVIRYLATALYLGPLPLRLLVVLGDLGELVLGVLDATLGLFDVYLVGRHRLLDQDLHQVLGDLEEAVGGRKDVPFVILVNPDFPGLDRGDDRRVVSLNPDVAIGDPRDHQVRLAVVDHLLGCNDPAEELASLLLLVLVLGHYSSSFSELSPSSESSSCSPLMPLAFSTASSMLPTM